MYKESSINEMAEKTCLIPMIFAQPQGTRVSGSTRYTASIASTASLLPSDYNELFGSTRAVILSYRVPFSMIVEIMNINGREKQRLLTMYFNDVPHL